jgi:hypothetical protein
VTRTTEHACQTLTLGKPKAQPQKHFPGIEQPHGLVTDDGKAVVVEIPPPPTRMEQPQLGDDVATLTVPSREAEADRVSSGPVPGLP